MKPFKKYQSLILIALFVGCVPNNKEIAQSREMELDTYQTDWASLGKHEASPQWFKDSKLGIYFHWGLYSVPAYGSEWYPRWMHFKDHDVYAHHIKKYGDPSEFGYHDFAPMFKAEKFNAEEWARLFKDAGAKFAGPVAEHHDGYAMWDSAITPWDVMDIGPKKDITGLLEKAIKEEDMKFITTFHHSKNLQRSNTLGKENGLSHFPYFENMPPSSDDPNLQLMYGNMEPDKWYEEVWLGKLNEVVDKYNPDIIWFDYVLGDIPEKYRKEFTTHYLNQAEKKNQEVVVIRKQHDLPLSMSVEDLEQARKKDIGIKTWMTDATISDGSWGYTEDLGVKKAVDILHMLIDVVSKNGVLLLNVSPMADGTIPQNQKDGLLEMGAWLKKYGEAIYGTETWYTFGEGPTVQPEGHFQNHEAFHKLKYSNKDIRYTTKDYYIYAIVMGSTKPNSELLLESFAKEKIKDMVAVKRISILGSDSNVKWEMTEEGLKVSTPARIVDTMATVIKIEIEQ